MEFLKPFGNWRWPGPERIRFHLWKVESNALLTNDHCLKTGMANDDILPICKSNRGTAIHVMRLPPTSELWRKLIYPAKCSLFNSLPIQVWILKGILTWFGKEETI